MCVRIKTRVVHTSANRKAVNYFSVRGIHHHHLRFVPAADEQAVSLGIVSETGRPLRHADGEAIFYFQRLWIEHDHFVGIFAVDVDKSILADDRLFAIALHRHSADYVTARCIDGRDVMRTVIIREYALGSGIVVDAVRASAHIDLFNELQRSRVKHRDFVLAAIAGEAVLESGSDRGAMNARRVGDRTDNLTSVDVDDFDLS